MNSGSFRGWRLIKTRWLTLSLLLIVAMTLRAGNALAINGNIAP